MTIHAWENYKLYAWGKNELRPLSKRAHTGSIFGAYELGATIVDGLDTLYMMDLKQEYQEGRDWVEQKFSFKNLVNESVCWNFQFMRFQIVIKLNRIIILLWIHFRILECRIISIRNEYPICGWFIDIIFIDWR